MRPMTAVAARSVGAAHPHAAMGRGHPQGGAKPVSAFVVKPGCDPLTEAFSGREFSPPWHGSTEVDASEAEAALERVFATPRAASAVAYIHVPLLPEPLPVLRLLSECLAAGSRGPFVDDVIAEIASRAATALVASAPIEAVYIGGGTPSALASRPSGAADQLGCGSCCR